MERYGRDQRDNISDCEPPPLTLRPHDTLSLSRTTANFQLYHLPAKRLQVSLHFIAALNKSTALDGKGRAINGRKAVDSEYVYTLQFTASDHECGEI